MVKVKRKKVGIIGIDRSGSRGNYPIVVVSVYSEKVGNFERAVKEIKERFKVKGEEIKGKDFGKRSHEKIIKAILSHGIKFIVYIVKGKIYKQISKPVSWKKKWEHVLEAVLWYKSSNLLINRLKVLPSELFYEKTYTSDKVFDNVLKALLYKRFGLKDVDIGYKYSPYIMVADWIANFFQSNPKVRSIFKKDIVYCEVKFVEGTLWKMLKEKDKLGSRMVGGSTAEPMSDQAIDIGNLGFIKFTIFDKLKELLGINSPGSRVVHGPTANLRMTRTIDILPSAMFKTFRFANKGLHRSGNIEKAMVKICVWR